MRRAVSNRHHDPFGSLLRQPTAGNSRRVLGLLRDAPKGVVW